MARLVVFFVCTLLGFLSNALTLGLDTGNEVVTHGGYQCAPKQTSFAIGTVTTGSFSITNKVSPNADGKLLFGGFETSPTILEVIESATSGDFILPDISIWKDKPSTIQIIPKVRATH
ncbi:hypothetical protein K440DRAFT_641464 [Wilcoxina mikolae CBS 423.85]|nr:hypothetical protein K440DRAFT_641464 [Wilcoxina mikolae CBS 423.85]